MFCHACMSLEFPVPRIVVTDLSIWVTSRRCRRLLIDLEYIAYQNPSAKQNITMKLTSIATLQQSESVPLKASWQRLTIRQGR